MACADCCFTSRDVGVPPLPLSRGGGREEAGVAEWVGVVTRIDIAGGASSDADSAEPSTRCRSLLRAAASVRVGVVGVESGERFGTPSAAGVVVVVVVVAPAVETVECVEPPNRDMPGAVRIISECECGRGPTGAAGCGGGCGREAGGTDAIAAVRSRSDDTVTVDVAAAARIDCD